jgi:hypothetical protein
MMESLPASTFVGDRLKAQYAPAYLTLTSIIQWAVITTLVARVEGTATAYTTANWLLVAATFLSFVVIWHEYLMEALAYAWMPGLVGSLVPFAFCSTSCRVPMRPAPCSRAGTARPWSAVVAEPGPMRRLERDLDLEEQ